ncbi:hypothetical protein C472_14812 [Halorubrum tebenquichense DSM 14210]|uniref:Uncharacterized protein n=1 Tax=Halorubrum tebenquichense DSM 14210 TaxID=1227485 RepID=M0DEF9_9EURY|nr:hypothetical protein C472_14812 [Halorubrum tebenquichense DSM 14210]
MEANASTETADDAHRPRCLRDDRPVRSCTAAAGSAVSRGAEATVRRAAFWTAIAFPAAYVVGAAEPVSSILPAGWLPVAIAANLLLLWVGHGAHHPE